MFCPNCGNRIPDGAAFCPSCGRPLKAPASPASPAATPGTPPRAAAPVPGPSKPKKSPVLPIVLIAVGVLLAAFVVLLFLVKAGTLDTDVPVVGPLAERLFDLEEPYDDEDDDEDDEDDDDREGRGGDLLGGLFGGVGRSAPSVPQPGAAAAPAASAPSVPQPGAAAAGFSNTAIRGTTNDRTALTDPSYAETFRAALAETKLGLILLRDDYSPDDASFLAAAQEVCDRLGVECVVRTNVPEDNSCYLAAIDLADMGCGVVFANAFGHEYYLMQAATMYPDVQFCCVGATQAHTAGLSNYHNVYAAIHEGRYLTGVAAGLKLNEMIDNGEITKDEARVGFVGAFPYAEVISAYTAFFLGVRSVCPDAVMEVRHPYTWLGSEGLGCAVDLILDGCVLLSQYSSSDNVTQFCEARGVPCVAFGANAAKYALQTCLISCEIDWAPCIETILYRAVSGSPIAADWTGTLENGSVVVNAPNAYAAATGTEDRLREVAAGLIDGSIRVFDTGAFTANGGRLSSLLGDVDDYGDFVADTELVRDGEVLEAYYRSAPVFELLIDGITVYE